MRASCRTRRPLTAIVGAALAITACGGSDTAAEPVRSYTLHLHTDDSGDEYDYIADDPVDVRVGDEVTFEVSVTGTLIHDLQIVDPEGTTLGSAPPAVPGDATSVTVLFEEPGFYRLNCLVDNHLTEHGMQAIIEVGDA